MKDLTPAQSDIFTFIQQTLNETGAPPTFREIQKRFKYRAVGTVQDHVKALVRKGHLESAALGKGKRKARALLPKNRPESVHQIPIYGEIAAGLTRDQEQIELGQLTVPMSLSPRSCFALRVVGNSMVEAGILEGDILIVERSARASTGEIVVALLNRETTVKRYEVRKGEVWLIPANSSMQPISTKDKELEIQGKVVGLQRKF